MLFSRNASLGALVSWCRSLRHGLQAGLDIPRVFEMQAKNGPMELRSPASDIAIRLRAGDSMQQAMAPHAERFPPLFNELVAVGEETGNLPELFGELEKYFTLRQTMIRDFRSAIILPIMQLFVALFLIIPGLIFILGMIGAPIKVFGLSGTGGALSWLFAWATLFGLGWLGFKMLQSDYGVRSKIEAVLFRIPKVGSCLRAFAMHRFCTGMHLTMGSAMPVAKGIDLSLRASGNAIFANASKAIRHSIKVGHDLTEAMAMSRIFEERFLHVVEVGEHSGRLSESMEQQARQYGEEAEFQLKALTKVAGFGVWGLVAVIMCFMILNLASTYLNILGSLGG